MDDEPPPRKQLRLLDRGRGKISRLLQRRDKKKRLKKLNLKDDHNESDIEDERPILSRINDPASAAKSALRIKLKVTYPNDSKDHPSLPAASQPASFEAQDSDDEDADTEKAQMDKRAIKAQRRKGIIGVEDLPDDPQATFSTRTLMAKQQPIATQPSTAQDVTKFTFNGNTLAPNGPAIAPSFGPQLGKASNAALQLQEAARSIFLQSKHKRTLGTQPQNASQEGQSGPRQDSGQKTRKLRTEPRDSRIASQQARTHALSTTRALDNFRLGLFNTVQPPRIDTAHAVENISDFVQSQVQSQKFGPAVYRSLYHQPTISRNLMERSLPDRIEARQFLEDVGSGSRQARKTEKGDVPALVDDTHTERVPIGARGKKAHNPATSLVPGFPATQLQTNLFAAPKRPQESFSWVPENLHTEPNRLAKAYLSSAPRDLKRKRRADATLPPPSYIHQHTFRPTFNVFSNGILLYPELCLLVAAHLPVQTLINLYSISKDYHVILNQRLTTVMLNQVSLKAPAAVRCYPWRFYPSLCQPDPAYTSATTLLKNDLKSVTHGTTVNIRHPPPAIHESTTIPGILNPNTHTIKHPLVKLPRSKRKIPTFRWLQMALHREKTIHEIYQLFAARGVPLPGDPTITTRNSFCLTLHKLWFAFDLPDNLRRMGYFGSNALITPSDLSNIITFIVKIDMIFNDPAAGEKRDTMRKLIMSAGNGFDTLRKVLKREMWTDEHEVLIAWTRHNFPLDSEFPNEPAAGGGWVPLDLGEDDHAASDYIFGVPRDEVGLLKKEFWGKLNYNTETRLRTSAPVGKATKNLMRPDQIVVREAIRRGMRMGRQYLRALMYGYVDEETLGAVPARDLNGGRSRVLEKEGEYGVDDLVGGVQALRVEDGGDPLLDLGNTWEGSPLTVKHVGARKQQVERRREEEERLEAYKAGWREDVAREEARRAYRGFTYIDG